MSARASSSANRTRVPLRQRVILRARRAQLARMGVVALVAVLLGVGIGRLTVPDQGADDRAEVERAVLPEALAADSIWTSSVIEGQPPIAEAIPLVRRGERLPEVRAWTDDWIEAYDGILVELTRSDLSPSARPVQRQFVAAVTLSRDAVEVLREATEAEDEVREALVEEVLRLRLRAEHLNQAARASVRDLAGAEGDVAIPPRLPGLGQDTDG